MIDFNTAYAILDKVAYCAADDIINSAFSNHLDKKNIDKKIYELDNLFKTSQSRYHAIIIFMNKLSDIDNIIFTSYLNSL